MKKVFQLMLFCLLALSAFAQTYPVNVSGTVLDANGSPVEGANILISTTPSNPDGFVFFKIVQTDAFGGYAEQIEVPNSAPQGTVTLSRLDCGTDSNPQSVGYAQSGNNDIEVDFDFCGAVSGSCNSWITVSYTGNSFAKLQPQASGNGPFTYHWGSGGSDFLTRIVTQSGTYCIVVEDATGCVSSTCATVTIGSNNPVDSCDVVNIAIDSLNNGVYLVAEPAGQAPFAYLWSTGETTQAITVTNWGINYCVTVTDANGCVATNCLFNQNTCGVNIVADPASGLTAIGTGAAPFTYLWSNGSTNASIQPNAPGNFCVTMTDATGCEATDCYWWGLPDSCGVYITLDTFNNGLNYTAIPNGTAPFTYQWQPGGNTQSIPLDPAYFGDYCVTVTDANGCIANTCYFANPPSCSVWIFESDTIGIPTLYAIASTPSNTVSYQWSTGQTTSTIEPTNPGTYCVTIYGGGCTATACYSYLPANNLNISGYIYEPDSTNAAVLDGIVELYNLDATTGTWNLLETTNIENDPNGWWNHYDFGTQTAGEYIVKVTLDPNSPLADDYLPTYHFHTVHWDEANVISLPSPGFGLFNVILSDGQNLQGGSGEITGTVTEGDGFASEDGERSGAPRPNTSVLLFDANEQPITHTVTDDLGQYSFSNLPFGTYKLEVEIVGIEQAERWVTLSPSLPSSTGNDFEVTETGIVLGLDNVFVRESLEVSPNPTDSELNVWVEPTLAIEARFIVSRPDGTMVQAVNQSVAKGGQYVTLDLNGLSSGLYILQVVAGNEVASAKVVKL